ncbi:DEAD/DEAH box helicase [Methylobrevis pamukkalensis]|uniref:ATP-dependent RNA helicase DeaD n=1 Tax=Methylobrevis pamukkalensis TaxID=1439726 RepID=A0A1E3H3F6_9HYPH|nr:DEAD/DEAH box helicase [Methylobrevis pamukkalensis]ODN70675.1 ATP-dependent RNA helicase DeaD [Methylobrevis pamukkalensis]
MTDLAAISPPLSSALVRRGYDALTPVQSAMLDPALAGTDLLVSAQTGSGKTVAFGMAISSDLLNEAGTFRFAVGPLALVIAPTRELALQVRREFEWLYADTRAVIASCVGGMDMRNEIRALENGAHIVVGTPGRLRDHVTRGSLDLSDIRAVVLDEADEMLDLGFREDLEFLLGAAPATRRTLMFSATVPSQIAKLAREFQRDAKRISLAAERTQHADIDYRLMPVLPHERENAIINALLLFDAENAIVFCSTREAVRHLESRLANRGFSVVALSGELSQQERSGALQAMRDGRARVCVATDVAARGIDLPNLDLVVHADLPSNPDTLLHRSGRTGRAGRKGTSIVIAPQHRRRSAERLLARASLTFTPMMPPSRADILERDRTRLLEDPVFTEAVGPDESGFIAELLARHSAEAIAAAYLRLYEKHRPTPEYLTEMTMPPPSAMVGERPETRFSGGTWFRLSLGRDRGADPRWLLPMICKAGKITKREVGSIRILERETRFEIHPEKADAYLLAITRGDGVEKGVTITPMGPGEDGGADDGPRRPRTERPRRTPAPAGAEGSGERNYAPRPPRTDSPKRKDGPKPGGPYAGPHSGKPKRDKPRAPKTGRS